MKPIRIMGSRRLGTEGFAVCSGVVSSPKRRCLWRVVAMRKDGVNAAGLLKRLPPEEGRAVFLLGARALVIVNSKGTVLQDNRKPGEQP